VRVFDDIVTTRIATACGEIRRRARIGLQLLEHRSKRRAARHGPHKKAPQSGA
jgi:hypothetical protein